MMHPSFIEMAEAELEHAKARVVALEHMVSFYRQDAQKGAQAPGEQAVRRPRPPNTQTVAAGSTSPANRSATGKARSAEPVVAAKGGPPTPAAAHGGGQPQSKPCKGCGRTKPLIEFHAQPKGKFGRESRCKACKSANRKTRLNQPDEEPDPVPAPSRRLVTAGSDHVDRLERIRLRTKRRAAGAAFVRCLAPRVPQSVAEEHVKCAADVICGALVFEGDQGEHLEEVHGLAVGQFEAVSEPPAEPKSLKMYDLTPEQVAEIERRYHEPGRSVGELAREFGVRRDVIYWIGKRSAA